MWELQCIATWRRSDVVPWQQGRI